MLHTYKLAAQVKLYKLYFRAETNTIKHLLIFIHEKVGFIVEAKEVFVQYLRLTSDLSDENGRG